MAVNRFATATLKLILIGLLAVFLSGAGLFSSKDDKLATDKNIKSTKPWANIDGFRSAKFGMKVKEVNTVNHNQLTYILRIITVLKTNRVLLKE